MSGITFGTDGWRAIIADDFTFANVQVVAQGIAYYITSQQLAKKGVVIGYDNRFLSEKFARACAQVLIGNGIKVFLPDQGVPTPVTAAMVRQLAAAGAIMVTASHNPPEYNGIKFIPYYAGPAMPEVTKVIEQEIDRVLEGAKIYELQLNEGSNLGLLEKIDPYQAYRDNVFTLLKKEHFNPYLKVVVDPMYGVGSGYLDQLLKELGIDPLVIHGQRDPLFGGIMPEPTSTYLRELGETVVKEGAALGLAADGDADRFGVVDEKGAYVSPNRLLALLLNYLLTSRSQRGPIARTVATSHRLDQIAAAYGLKVIETPVGFKYIGECLREQGAILGGEESGGMSIFGHIPEKDGILAGLLTVEMVAASGKSLGELEAELTNTFKPLVSERLDLQYESNDREIVLDRLNQYNPRSVNGASVEKAYTIDGKKVILEDGSWFLLRASGTEPLFRLYVEAASMENLKAIQKEVRDFLGI
ncbi:MAG: phosphoglucomutase/phosphomannomutase family protein [Methylocystaceae bacterium]